MRSDRKPQLRAWGQEDPRGVKATDCPSGPPQRAGEAPNGHKTRSCSSDQQAAPSGGSQPQDMILLLPFPLYSELMSSFTTTPMPWRTLFLMPKHNTSRVPQTPVPKQAPVRKLPYLKERQCSLAARASAPWSPSPCTRPAPPSPELSR